MKTDNKLNDMKKDAKASVNKQEFPNGCVYGFVGGGKNFFPLSRLHIDLYGKTVGELADEVVKQRTINENQQKINKALSEEIKKLKKQVERYVG